MTQVEVSPSCFPIGTIQNLHNKVSLVIPNNFDQVEDNYIVVIGVNCIDKLLIPFSKNKDTLPYRIFLFPVSF